MYVSDIKRRVLQQRAEARHSHRSIKECARVAERTEVRARERGMDRALAAGELIILARKQSAVVTMNLR